MKKPDPPTEEEDKAIIAQLPKDVGGSVWLAAWERQNARVAANRPSEEADLTAAILEAARTSVRFLHGRTDDYHVKGQYHYPNHDKNYPPAETQTLAQALEEIEEEEENV